MSPPKKIKIEDKDDSDIVSDSESNGKDWRDQCHGVRDINSYALRKKILTDVIFHVGPKKSVFQAHRLILALGSPVFEAMFYGPLAENNGPIIIPDVEPDGFNNLLKFLYSENIAFWDEMAAFKTAFAADKYCVVSLKRKCEEHLCNVKVSPSNVWFLLQNSIYLDLITVRRRCYSFLREEAEPALQHNMFPDVDSRTVETFLREVESSNVPERTLLEYAMFWARHNSSADDPDSFKSAMEPLLRCICFGNLDPKDFIYFLEIKRLQEVLDAGDALKILKHILMPRTCELPAWCMRSRQQTTDVRPSARARKRALSMHGSVYPDTYIIHRRTLSPTNATTNSSRAGSRELSSSSSDDSSSSSSSLSTPVSSPPRRESLFDSDSSESSD